MGKVMNMKADSKNKVELDSILFERKAIIPKNHFTTTEKERAAAQKYFQKERKA